MRAALQQLATAQATTMVQVLHEALQHDTRWATLVAAVRRTTTAALSERALAVLRDQRGKFIFANESSHSKMVLNLLRVLRRRGAEAPHIQSVGVPCARQQDEAVSFMDWVDAIPSGKLRPTPAEETHQGPRAYVRQWHLHKVEAHGVVCFGRAGDRVREWRRKAGASADDAPPEPLAAALVHTDILPTATASRPDKYWLTQYERYMSVREVTQSFGIGDTSPLSLALQRVPCPTNAVTMLGKSIHAGVATAILRHLDTLGFLPDKVDYASACSGIDTFATAMDSIRPGAWNYLHVAEKDKRPRAVLRDAWGLAETAIHHDATSPQAAGAARTHVYVVSPECKKFSRRHADTDGTHLPWRTARQMPRLCFPTCWQREPTSLSSRMSTNPMRLPPSRRS